MMEAPMLLPELREEVCQLHAELPRNNLVAWTSGNISGRDPVSQLIVIKPSGLRYQQLRPETMVIVDEQGRVVQGELVPSSDTASHCAIYRRMPALHGIAHTHSRYATAFAVLGQAIPCLTTAMADEFGGAIPCAGFASIGDEQIGELVVAALRGSRSPAILLQNHGVFAVGKSAEAAVKAALMTEDSAAIVWAALQLGAPLPIPQADIDRLHQRYQKVYGQRESM